MKTVSVRALQKRIKEAVDSAQSGRVVVTRRGQPAAVLLGVEEDWEEVVLETSSAFWELIEQRRREETLSMEELERELEE